MTHTGVVEAFGALCLWLLLLPVPVPSLEVQGRAADFEGYGGSGSLVGVPLMRRVRLSSVGPNQPVTRGR